MNFEHITRNAQRSDCGRYLIRAEERGKLNIRFMRYLAFRMTDGDPHRIGVYASPECARLACKSDAETRTEFEGDVIRRRYERPMRWPEGRFSAFRGKRAGLMR